MEANGMRIATLRKHSSGNYFVKFAGKSHYLGKDRAVAERKYRFMIAEHYGRSFSTPGVTNSITVKELIEQYVTAELQRSSEKWKSKREHVFVQVKRHVSENYGELAAEDFGPKAFKAVRQLMAEEEGRNVSYVNMLASKLRAAWRWGVSEELVSESSYRRLMTVKELQVGDHGLAPAKTVVPVPEDLYSATLPYLSETMADVVRLLWITAARPGEILALTPAEVARSGSHLVYRPVNHKTAKTNKLRAIVFGEEGEKILKRYWPSDPLARFFPDYSDATVIRNAIYRACVRARLERWHPYQLRHAAVTRIALEHGKEVAAAVAGHAKVLTTERYDDGAVERAKKAAK